MYMYISVDITSAITTFSLSYMPVLRSPKIIDTPIHQHISPEKLTVIFCQVVSSTAMLQHWVVGMFTSLSEKLTLSVISININKTMI